MTAPLFPSTPEEFEEFATMMDEMADRANDDVPEPEPDDLWPH